MKSYALFISILTTATALLWPGTTFWKNSQPSFTKVCLYSNDPSKFTPMCILCPNTLYPIVLNTCVMGSTIPLNVSYTQANCIVGNCAVNMNPKPAQKPKRDVSESSEGIPETASLASKLFGGNLPSNMDEDDFQTVPYTIMVDGHNITVTLIEEYYVHSDEQPDDDTLDEELE